MKKIFLSLCLMLIIGSVLAQDRPPGHEGGASASGHIYGKLVDSAGHGIGEVSVMILKVSVDPGSDLPGALRQLTWKNL